MTPATLLRALRYPLSMAPLIVIALFSVCIYVAAHVGLIGIPLMLILSSWYLKYTFAVLDAAAVGAAESPVLSVEMINPLSEQRSLVMLAIVVAVFFASGAARYWFGTAAAIGVGAIAFGIIPGMILVQAASGSVLQSFNPVVWLGTVRQLNLDYVWLLLALGAIAAITALVSVGGLFGTIAFTMYAGLVAQSLMGGLLHEHRQDEWFDDASLPQRRVSGDDPHLEQTRKRFMDALYAEWRNGAKQNAWRDVVSQFEKSASPLDELRWIYRSTAAWPDPQLANRIAQEMIPRLLAAKNNSEPFDLARQRLAADREFRPLASADLMRLATLARDVGDRKTARALLHEFDRFYPNDPRSTHAAELAREVAR